MTFDLSITGGGEPGNEFNISITPSVDDVPYVYAVMEESAEWEVYFPDNLYDYFHARYEASMYDGTFAQYVEDIMLTGSYNGKSEGFANDGDDWYFKLVAAGVTIEGENVTFYSPTEMNGFYEMW